VHRPTDLPRWVYVPAVLGAAFVVLPLLAIAIKVDWPNFWALITSSSSKTALLLSLKTATASTALCVLCGVPMALVLARSTARVVRLLRPLILLPLVLPPVVGGIALLYAFGRLGLIGHYLEAAGVNIAFSTTAVVLAQTFVSLPFLVISLEGAARTAGAGFETVAATLGARPSTVWWRVTLPLLLPAVLAGMLFAFTISFDDVTGTLFWKPAGTETVPTQIFAMLRNSISPQINALGTVMIVITVALPLLGAAISRRFNRAPQS